MIVTLISLWLVLSVLVGLVVMRTHWRRRTRHFARKSGWGDRPNGNDKADMVAGCIGLFLLSFLWPALVVIILGGRLIRAVVRWRPVQVGLQAMDAAIDRIFP